MEYLDLITDRHDADSNNINRSSTSSWTPRRMDSYQKTNLKSPSTEFSDEFVDIVNEINDFISVLEVRQKELAEGESVKPAEKSSEITEPIYSEPPSETYDRSSGYYRADSGAEFQSDSRTESSLGADSRTNSKSDCRSDSQSNSLESSLSDLGKALEDHPKVIENDYEPLTNIIPGRYQATATATASTVRQTPSPAPAQKPQLPPKPPGLQKMVEPGANPKKVKSLHHFKGANNDELCFAKGDIITVTQGLEGGWWEGTLNEKTGWFPSNYVREFKQELTGSLKGGPGAQVGVPKGQSTDPVKHCRESMQFYHNVVLQSVIETERTHVAEMTSVLQTYIRPILNSDILSTSEFSDLTGNLEDIIVFQQNFLVSLEECSKHSAHQRRVGGVFMRHAPSLKELYTAYCANHPRAVAILQKNRDELSRLMEKLGAPSPGSMTLTTYLSKPFTRLEKYPSLLKELERHIEESHVDRGDTQRAIAVYRDVANYCMEIRKLKEMEHEIITSSIKGWEGEEITSLGEVTHLSQVKVESQTGEKFERIFVLFQNSLLMLSMSPRLSGYQYEGKLPLSGLKVTLFEDDGENESLRFEISGNMIEKLQITCGTKGEVNSWLEALKDHVVPNPATSNANPVSIQVSTSQPSISTLTLPKTAKVSVASALTNFTMSKTWSMSCLRPSPPLRPPLLYRDDGMRSPRMGRKLGRRKPERTHSQDEYDKRFKKYDPRTNSEDALILTVIEAYCTSAKTRHTVNSSILYSPQVLIPQEEKIIVDDGSDDAQEKYSKIMPVKKPENIVKSPEPINSKPKPWAGSLVDTVYSLRDQVKALETEQNRLRRDLDDEAKTRKSLENLVKKYLKGIQQQQQQQLQGHQTQLPQQTDNEIPIVENHT